MMLIIEGLFVSISCFRNNSRTVMITATHFILALIFQWFMKRFEIMTSTIYCKTFRDVTDSVVLCNETLKYQTFDIRVIYSRFL